MIWNQRVARVLKASGGKLRRLWDGDSRRYELVLTMMNEADSSFSLVVFHGYKF